MAPSAEGSSGVPAAATISGLTASPRLPVLAALYANPEVTARGPATAAPTRCGSPGGRTGPSVLPEVPCRSPGKAWRAVGLGNLHLRAQRTELAVEALALAVLGHGEQHHSRLQRLQGVPAAGHDQQVAGRAVPGRLARAQPDAPMQDVQGRLPWILVLVEGLAGGQGDHGLAQYVLVAPVHGVRATPARRGLGEGELLAGQGGQRKLLHPNLSFCSVSLSVPDMCRVPCLPTAGVTRRGRRRRTGTRSAFRH